MARKKKQKPIEHNIDSAFYALDYDDKCHPVLACSCGFGGREHNGDWRDAGAAMDAHLEEVQRGEWKP